MTIKQTIQKLMAILLCLTFSFGFLVSSVAETINLTDIAGNKYESTIKEWVQNGFIKGNTDGTFKPNNKATRAEFMALVNRSFKFTEIMPVKFNDIKKTDWFYTDVQKASKVGYMIGFAGKIEPRSNISRQQLAIVVMRLGNLKNIVNDALLKQFTDYKDIPDWSKGAISIALENKFFEGFVTKAFKPTENVSRVEIVVVLDRLLKFLTPVSEQTGDVVAGGPTVAPGTGGGVVTPTFTPVVSPAPTTAPTTAPTPTPTPVTPPIQWPVEVQNVAVIVSELSQQTYVNVDISATYTSQVKQVLVDGSIANKMPGGSQWRATAPSGTTLSSLEGKIIVILYPKLIESATASIDFVGTTHVRVLLKAGVNASSVTANGTALTFNTGTGKWDGTFDTLVAGSSITIQVTDTVSNIDSLTIPVSQL